MKKNRLNLPPIPILFIFISGFFVRLYYVTKSIYFVRQHDVNYFGAVDGHAGYIQYLMDNWSLPDFDPSAVWQMGHPPLHHFICAVWMKIQIGVFGATVEDAAESLQYLSLVYTMLIAYIAYRLFVHLGLNGTALYVATGIVTLHPAFIFLSGSINNDTLSTLFMIAAIYFAMRWYKEEKTRHLLLCALCIGLGMMTKLSVVVCAVPIAFLLIYKLVKKIREKGWKELVLPYSGFALISLPLGLWFPIYNNIRWGMPLLFVHPMDSMSPQYLGDRSLLSRSLDFSSLQFKSMYLQFAYYPPEEGGMGYNEFNPLVTTMKSSCFGEYVKNRSFSEAPVYDGVAGILLFSSVLIAAVAFISMIVLTARKKTRTDTVQTVFMILFYATMMVGLYRNAAAYPFVCTSDFRYITLTVVVGSLFFGMLLMRLWQMIHVEPSEGKKGRLAAFSYYGLLFCSGVFMVSAFVFPFGVAKYLH